MDVPVPDSGLAKDDDAMDVPVSDPGLVKDDFSLETFHCDGCDRELVHKLAQLLLPGLATACVDNTTGGLFKIPASVAVEIRKEMIDYILQRSETIVAELMVQREANDEQTEEASDDPVEVVSIMIDDFIATKRNFFSRVSAWLLSDSREDKIDDFVQEMEMNEFWPLERREAMAEMLLRNVDFKYAHHCVMKYESIEQLEDHRIQCGFRTVYCENDGCKTKFSAVHAEKHDAECPYKILDCEQKCSESIMRREMDRHCITVCSMRLANCPFYQLGCQSAFPHCVLDRHCEEFLTSHLVCVLRVIHKKEVSLEELQQRAQLLKSAAETELSKAKDVRSLTLAIKKQEERMKKLQS